MSRRSLFSIGCVLLTFLSATATASLEDVAYVEAEVHSSESACLPAFPSIACPIERRDNGTSAVGDDTIETTVFVDRVSIGTKTGLHGPPEIVLSPKDITLGHPVYREWNLTWHDLNDSRPQETRSLVGFESRPRAPAYDEHGNRLPDEWGVFLVAYPTGMNVGWCWDICSLNNQSYMRQTEDEVQPFPDGVILWNYDKDAVSTDQFMERRAYEVEDCRATQPRFGCDTAVGEPLVREASAVYRDATPTVITAMQFNETAIRLDSESPVLSRSPQDDHVSERHRATTGILPGKKLDRPWVGLPRGDAPILTPGGTSGTAAEEAPEVPASRTLTAAPSAPSPHPSLVLAAGLAAAATALFAAVWFLYHRVNRREGLDQDTRRRIYDEITATPGLRASSIAARLGVSHNTAKYHLRRLETWQLVRGSHEPQPRYFPATLDPRERDVARELSNETSKRVLINIPADREVSHSSLSVAVGLSLPTIGRAVARLEAAGLVQQQRVGRRVVVRLTSDA